MRLPNDIIVHYEERADCFGIEGHYAGELIRCRDCKAYLPETETLASYCPILNIYGLPEDAYCYKAQRREG